MPNFSPFSDYNITNFFLTDKIFLKNRPKKLLTTPRRAGRVSLLCGEGFSGSLGKLAKAFVPIGLGGRSEFGDASLGTWHVERFLDHGVVVVLLSIVVLLPRCSGRV